MHAGICWGFSRSDVGYAVTCHEFLAFDEVLHVQIDMSGAVRTEVGVVRGGDGNIKMEHRPLASLASD